MLSYLNHRLEEHHENSLSLSPLKMALQVSLCKVLADIAVESDLVLHSVQLLLMTMRVW